MFVAEQAVMRGWLVEPCPTFTPDDPSDSERRYAKLLGYFPLRRNTMGLPYFLNIPLIKFAPPNFCTFNPRPMGDLVGHILSFCCPSQMARIAARPVAAGVRNFMCSSWGLSMCFEAYNTVCKNKLSFDLDPTITEDCFRIRPFQTLIRRAREGFLSKKRHDSLMSSTTAKRVAVLLPSVIMRSAITSTVIGLAAAIYGAYFAFSHSEVTFRCGQGLALFPQRLRPVFRSRFTLCSQHVRVAQ